jgi:hypothetical protein
VLLVIDAGNTQTVVGLYDIDSESSTTVQASDGLIDHWRIATEAERTSDEMAAMLQSFLNLRGHSLTDDVTGMAVSSGVPRVTANHFLSAGGSVRACISATRRMRRRRISMSDWSAREPKISASSPAVWRRMYSI